jgi:signal transduction histidine kinase
MKTSAFLIRVAICFLLSLIPVSELENRIYSSRLELRGHWEAAPHVTLVELGGMEPDSGWTGLARERARLLQAAALAEGAKVALVLDPAISEDLMPDADGILRRASLITRRGNAAPLRAFMLARSKGVKVNARNISHPERTHLINFVGEAGSIPRCVAAKCLENPSLAFKDKIVLIGPESDLQPTFRTPLGDMTWAEVVANDVETIVMRKPIYAATWPGVALMILAMIFLASFYIMYYPVMISAIAVAGTGIAVVVVIFQSVFQLFDVYIPSANIGGSLLVTYLVFTGYRLAFQENLQWRAHKQAQYLRELDQLKTNFLSLVSHDLKTPISKIQAVAERMKRDSQKLPSVYRAEWLTLLESIENSNNELKHTITSILNLSKIEAHKVILNKKSNDINLIITAALRRFAPLAELKNIEIEVALEPLFSVECDEDLLRQVINNLVDNAIKYSPAGSRVIVRSREEEGFVRVEVQDFGPGISNDELPKMFRKFSRLRPAAGTRELVKGTGLGLYLSKYFIELHGGKIQVKSIAGQTTTFSFTLPLEEAAPQENAPQETTKEPKVDGLVTNHSQSDKSELG